MGHNARKSVLGFVNNKGTDQPEHLCSLIGPFVVHYLDYFLAIPCS